MLSKRFNFKQVSLYLCSLIQVYKLFIKFKIRIINIIQENLRNDQNLTNYDYKRWPKQTFVLRYTQADLQVYIYQKQYYGKYISYISNQQILKQTRGIFPIYEVLEYINAVKDKSKAFQIFYLKDRAMLKLNFISKIYGQMPLKFDILKVSNSKINDAKYEELKRIPNESTTNKTVEEINQKIDKIEKLIQQRGFKDFGRDHCIIKGCSSACVVDVNRAQRNSNAIISSEHCANNQRFIFQKVSQHEKVYRIKSEYPGQYLTVQYDKDGSLVVFRDKNEANDLQKFKVRDIGGKTCIISTLNDMHLSVRWGANESGKQIIATYNPQFQTHFWRLQRPREDFELL